MIYLAGSCSSEQRTMMVSIAKALRSEGYDIYCPFELKIPNAWDYPQEEWAKMVFDADKQALDSCNMVIMVSPGRISSAGTNWEQGYAFAKNKTLYVFQFTEAPTSLMTYCGCTKFFNTKKDRIITDILNVIKEGPNGCPQISCSTTLT
jgi:nucleoside 2-deoxyribosyltransferase